MARLMSKLDQFASAFKSAAKEIHRHSDVPMNKVLVVTDLDEERSHRFADDVKNYLSGALESDGAVTWERHRAGSDEDVGDLLGQIESHRPDLICSYRNLHSRAKSFPFSLGAHVDVLTQATTTPVLLLPTPTEDGRLSPECKGTQQVMVLTDHLTGCNHLIDCGVRFCQQDGLLVLAHLEDDTTFERYMSAISKIPVIDTDSARERIAAQLLKEPADFIGSVQEVLGRAVPALRVKDDVRMGHCVGDCKSLISDHQIGLVVMNTKDDEQLAMHGLAYPIAIELRNVALLML